MRLFFSIALLGIFFSFSAQETITYPYNPDGDVDGAIAAPDLLDLLGVYGGDFSPSDIQIDGVDLLQVIQDIQNQLGALQGEMLDANYVESMFAALQQLIDGITLAEGTSIGQFLIWNGVEWELVMPKVGCTDTDACNYDATAHVLDEDKCIYQDACGVCDGPGEIYECGCSDTPEGDCDCDGNQLDALNVCGGECAADEDGDGICDDGDSCIGEADECGVCNGPGAIYDCGCTEPAPETCDCDGNVVDAVGVCGGGCQEDADADGICDSQDPCVGELDACGVCNGPGPILGCGCNNIPEGDCDCQGNQLDAVGTCGGACQTDINGDGVCDDDSIPGCTYDAACNYDPSASINDGSCDFTTCYGCTDIEACNYSAAATFDNQSCSYPVFAYNCDNTCITDSDGDGYCDELEIYGCTDEEACNYEVGATELDNSCTYPGCTDSTFCSFDPEAGCDNGSCADGYAACIDSEACNYDSEAICGGIECVYPGCFYPQANNYDPEAGCDDGSCIIEGCMIDLACNFDPLVNLDDGSCEFGNCPGCNDPEATNYNPTSTNDEICNFCNSLEYHGYNYELVQIGNQCWFAENLRATVDLYGNDIEGIVAPNLSEVQVSLYGWLYPGVVITSQEICPANWSVPSELQVQQLEAYLGMTESQLTETGSRTTGDVGWKIKSLQANGNNITGFNLLMAGSVEMGIETSFGTRGRFGTKSIDENGNFWYRYIDIFENWSGRTAAPILNSLSVRCIND